MEFNLIKISNSFNSGVGQPMRGGDNIGSTSTGVADQKTATVTDSQTVSTTTATQPGNQFLLLPTKRSLLRDVVVAMTGAAMWTIVMLVLGIH